MQTFRRIAILVCCVSAVAAAGQDSASGPPVVGFQETDRGLNITIGDTTVASYVISDKAIPRPYFAHVKTRDGRQVTRNHPPRDGDPSDHPTMHPGIWMAFGDVNGNDFWRNRASIVHEQFDVSPHGGPGAGAFTDTRKYVASDGKVVCREEFCCDVRVLDDDWLLSWDSTFSADHEIAFGDQEEMGLGMRVTTAISEVHGGLITDSEGRSTAANVWSHAAAWCDYSGTVDGRFMGLTLMCHPGNFRSSWMHARNYGLVAANPFGQLAMNQGPRSRILIPAGESLRLRYGIVVHGSGTRTAADHQRHYGRYVSLTGPPIAE